MGTPPLILVSPSIEKHGVEFHDLSASLSLRYNSAILAAGGIPLTVPTTTDRATLAEAVRRTDGVLLTGGDDINPRLYDEKLPAKVRKTVGQTPDGGARDVRELMLIEEIFRQHKPVLAICRGHQMLNVAFGGKLLADIRQQLPGALDHQRMDKPLELVHEAA
ncbi:MAG TPA: gamma-glutamyl-gamma-aminobutyrate hydrolase family protein, partial [Verrucomicrobiae bacterium]